MFFSFPHISVDAKGSIGAISRPGRPGPSCACGALQAALIDIKKGGLENNCKQPGGEARQTLRKRRLIRSCVQRFPPIRLAAKLFIAGRLATNIHLLLIVQLRLIHLMTHAHLKALSAYTFQCTSLWIPSTPSSSSALRGDWHTREWAMSL